MSNLHKKLATIARAMHVPKDKSAYQNRYRFKSANDILCQAKKVLQDKGIDDVDIYVTDNDPVFKDCKHNLSDKLQILKLLFEKTDSSLRKIDNALVKSLIELPEHEVYCVATATITDGTDSISTKSWAKVDYQSESNRSLDPAQVNGKVSSYARKYALTGLLMVDDEEDSDVEQKPKQKPQHYQSQPAKPPVVAKISQSQIKNVLELLKPAKVTLDELLTVAKVDKIEDILASKVEKLKAWLISDRCRADVDKVYANRNSANDKVAQNEQSAIDYAKQKAGVQ